MLPTPNSVHRALANPISLGQIEIGSAFEAIGNVRQVVPDVAADVRLGAKGNGRLAVPTCRLLCRVSHRKAQYSASLRDMVLSFCLMIPFDMTPIGEKFKLARKWARPALNQEEFSKLLGLDRSVLSKIEIGMRTVHPPELMKAVQHTNFPLAWFMDEDSDLNPVQWLEEKGNVKEIPGDTLTDQVALAVWRGVEAGVDGECEFYSGDSAEFELIPAFLAANDPDNHVLLIVRGPSMLPRVDHAERVVLRLAPDAPLGSIVCCQRPDGGAKYLKVLRRPGRKLELDSLNEEYPPIRDLTGWETIGYAVAILHNYEPGKPNIEWDTGRALKA